MSGETGTALVVIPEKPAVEYRTVVFEIRDQVRFGGIWDLLMPLFLNGKEGDPFRITAASVYHEISRVNLIEELRTELSEVRLDHFEFSQALGEALDGDPLAFDRKGWGLVSAGNTEAEVEVVKTEPTSCLDD